jgi:20S proteasome alpha/beta subunit
MKLEKLSDRVAQELDKALADDLPAAEREEILDIVRRAMLDASTRTTREMKETAVVCCGPEADLAHKIQEQMDKKRNMLIANLMAMR